MDRVKPVYVKQRSNMTTPASPNVSSTSQHARSASTGVGLGIGSARRGQQTAPKAAAAAQRMAHMMASQTDEDEEEDDLLYNPSGSSGGVGGIGLAGRAVRPRSPMVISLILKIWFCVLVSSLYIWSSMDCFEVLGYVNA